MEKIAVPTRMTLAQDEKKFAWLPMLLDAYAIIDKGVESAIYQEESKTGARPACKNGCNVCCTALKDIPVYPLEIVGIYWYATEKIKGNLRGQLRKQLSEHIRGNPCPFLTGGLCSVYPLRPIACRQFLVFNSPCSSGEDPYYTRRNDVLTPLKEYTDNAFYVTLPFYGVTEEKTKEDVIRNSLIHTQVRVLQMVNWNELSKVMDEFDSRDRTT